MLTIRDSQMQNMAQTSAGKPIILPCANTETFVEICLLDAAGKPVSKARYRIQLPDFSVVEGVLDDQGRARVEHIIAGQCAVCFPEYDGREWRPA